MLIKSDLITRLSAATEICTFERAVPEVVSIVPFGVSKGEAARTLCLKLGVDIENALAFGDGMNDKALFQAVGFSIAMAMLWTA